MGLDSALRALAATPLGPWLLLVVVIGLIMFGAYSCCEARWRGYAFRYDDVAPTGGADQSGAVSSGSPGLLTVTLGSVH